MKAAVLQKIGIVTGIGISVSVSAVLIRFLFFKKNSKVDCSSNENNPVELKLEVPRKSLGHIIGKRGTTIRKIRERTQTTIKVWDESEDLAVIVVRGQKKKAESAMREINLILTSLPRVFTKDIFLSETTWPAVVGVHGDNVRSISSESKTELTVKWLESAEDIDHKSSKYVVTIKGSNDQISHAISLIDERVALESISQENKSTSLAGRASFYNLSSNIQTAGSQETFPTNTLDGFVQVYVSAVQSPNHFWVQLYGPRSTELDKLTVEMTDFHKNEMNHHSSNYRMQSVVPGELVAAYHKEDSSFYRALVLSVENHIDNITASVLYVDFGDSGVINLNDLYKLKPEYMSMPLQGIKCCLYDVMPIDGDRWSMEAIHLFEEITYWAQWKPIMAKVANVPTSGSNSSLFFSESSDIVLLSLFDKNGTEDIDISERLVSAGYAKRVSNYH